MRAGDCERALFSPCSYLSSVTVQNHGGAGLGKTWVGFFGFFCFSVFFVFFGFLEVFLVFDQK